MLVNHLLRYNIAEDKDTEIVEFPKKLTPSLAILSIIIAHITVLVLSYVNMLILHSNHCIIQ